MLGIFLKLRFKFEFKKLNSKFFLTQFFFQLDGMFSFICEFLGKELKTFGSD